MMAEAYTVIFDACVLYPFALRDLLVQMATTELFRGRWSRDIHEEWMGALADGGKCERSRLERIRDLMDRAVPDCIVRDYEDLIPGIQLPDANDRHVVAAAIRCGAQTIVTKNVRDFPSACIGKYGIEAQHPDIFMECQFGLSSAKVCLSAHACRARLKNPPYSVSEYLSLLERQELFRTARLLQPYSDLL